MLFADVDLASRIERAEGHLLRDASMNVARRIGDPAVFVEPIGGGVAAFTEPGSPLNKVVGLGFDGALDELALTALEDAYAARGAGVRVEVASLADPSVVRLLTRRGYMLAGFENVLGRHLPVPDLPRPPAGVDLATSDVDKLDAWLDVMVTGFAAPDLQGVPSHESYDREVLRRIMRDFATADGVARYLARRGGAPVGGGTMRTAERVAQLCGAATLPEHRRRGVQSALLAARLADAARAGCDIAVITTEPGTRSQQNVQRQGFDLLYTRAVLVRGS